MGRYERIEQLLQSDFATLQEARVLVLGLGGVGGMCVECLRRSGAGHITGVDRDRFERSNQNRQLGSEALGEYKANAFAKSHGITPVVATIDQEWIDAFDFGAYDLVIDAIDDMAAKVALAHACSDKLISSTGSARKFDPTCIQTASIWHTTNDPLAKKFRYELKKSGFRGDFTTVYSTENCNGRFGSFMGVTGAFGLSLCALAVKKLV